MSVIKPKNGHFYWIQCTAYDPEDIFIAECSLSGSGLRWITNGTWFNHDERDVKIIKHIPKPRVNK